MRPPTDELGSLDLDRCMLRDAARIRRRLRELPRSPPDRAARLARLLSEVRASADRRRRRAEQRPRPRFAIELPILLERERIAAAIREHPVVVVCGETGSGKSTQLPQICLELGRGDAGLIGHTQPRRLAARSVAARIAEELGEPLGGSIGYQVRFQDRTGPDGFIKLMTDGILLAEVRSDRQLLRYDTIIIDEAHERGLNVDFLLGFLKKLLPKRRDLKVIVTSATIDPQRFSDHFGGAPIIEVGGRTYPVDVRYRPLAREDPDEADRKMPQAIVDAVDEIDRASAEGPGDVLVFLAGEREIRETADYLRRHGPRDAELLPLFARLSPDEQHRVFEPHGRQRIVLATNVAETSLTVPGIRGVVDPGLARISHYSPRTKVQRLPIEPISQASAQQRAGRCGRVGPGVCIRLYAETDFEKREPYTPPEILRTNLASVILQMEAIGLGRVESFPFLDPPRRSMVRDGYETLRELGAIDEKSGLTAIGRRLARLPIDPRLGRMLLAADDEGCLEEVLIIASALEMQDPRVRPAANAADADAAHRRLADRHSDFLSYLKLWRAFHAEKADQPWSAVRRWCEVHFVSFMRMREWQDLHRQLRSLAEETGLRRNETPATPDQIHRAVLVGLLSNVARLREKRSYDGARGGEVFIHPGSVLTKATPKWIVAAEIVETTRRFARCVARVRPEWIERAAGHLVRRGHTDPRWDPKSAQVIANERVTLFGLELIGRRPIHYGPLAPVYARELFIHHALVEGAYETDAPFFRHNHDLVESIRREEARRRRRDLLVDVDKQYDFYDRRVPAHVYSGKAFDRWRRRAEHRTPRLLFLSREELVVPDATATDDAAFPTELVVDDLRMPLHYALDPTSDEDGVTVVVPVGLSGQLPEARLAWLVPGLLEEKVTALLRTLPKTTRRELVPAPDVAKRAVAELEFGRGDLLGALSHVILRQTGVDVPRDAWDPGELPRHLRMNVRIVDDAGTAVAAGRDLAAVRRATHRSAETTVAAAAQASELPVGERLTAWTIEHLPERVRIQEGDHALTAYPALVDLGDAAGIEVQPDDASALRAHRAGLRRLFALRCGEELAVHLDHLPERTALRRLYATLGPADRLDDQLALRIAETAFLASDADVRSADAFEARFDQGWPALWDTAREVAVTALRVLEQHHAVRLVIAEKSAPIWREMTEDVAAQVDRLVTPTFVTDAPLAWWPHLPRYLEAAQRRIEKGGSLERDAERALQVAAWWRRYAARRDDLAAQGRVSSALEDFRWLLEELRVSLFAQELGTAVPVSAKRLEQAWAAIP